MPDEWKFGYVIPLPKKGDKTLCKNWRGILLLSVPGKIFARVTAARGYISTVKRNRSSQSGNVGSGHNAVRLI